MTMTPDSAAVRLAKALSSAGLGSRRRCELMIQSGRVTVDGAVVLNPAVQVTAANRVALDGTVVWGPGTTNLPAPLYIALHKPVGVAVTMARGGEKGTILAEWVNLPGHVHPIGRLDADTSGLLLLTNDGDLTHRLTHPRYQVPKEYEVRLDRRLSSRDLERLGAGVPIDGRPVAVDGLVVLADRKVRITLHEGRHRIVRRLFGALGCKVVELKRTAVGSVRLARLPVGKWRKLTPAEVAALKSAVGLEG